MIKYLLHITLAVTVSLVVVALSPLSTNIYWLDVTNSITPHLIVLCCGMVLFLICKARKLIGIVVICAFGMVLYYLMLPASLNAHHEPSITIKQLNLNYFNTHINNVYDALNANQSDITALFEVNDNDRARFIKLAGNYYDFGSAEIEGFPDGIGIISKFPIVKRITHKVFNNQPRGIIVELHLAIGHEKMRLLALHPPSPRSQHLWHQRNLMLRYLTRLLNQPHDVSHTLVLGDFNTTPYSPHFPRFNTYNACYVIAGHYASWFWTTLPPSLFKLIGLTIDHCLISDSLELSAFSTQQVPGSDHAMLKYNILLPAQ